MSVCMRAISSSLSRAASCHRLSSCDWNWDRFKHGMQCNTAPTEASLLAEKTIYITRSIGGGAVRASSRRRW